MKNNQKIKSGCIFALLLVALCFDSCKKGAQEDNHSANQGTINGLEKPFFSGYIQTPQSVLDKLPKFAAGNAKTEANFPTSFTLSTPPIGDQTTSGTCVGWATSYTTWSTENYYRTASTTYDNTKNVFSINYIYNQLSTDCSSGTYIPKALDLLKSQGACTYATLPFNATNCSSAVSQLQKNNAASNKITNVEYYLLDKTTRQNTFAIKMLLFQKHPIVFGCNVDKEMGTGTWTKWGSPRLNVTLAHMNTNQIGTEIFNGRHAMAIVGYDDSKHAFKVQNQWGTKFGDNGFLWIDYDFFGSGTLPKYTLASYTYDAKTNNYNYIYNSDATVSNDVITEAYVLLN